MRNERCETCRFWEPYLNVPASEVGYCHRFPPTWHPSELPDAFTTTMQSGWCGEWQRISNPEVDRHNERILAQAKAI